MMFSIIIPTYNRAEFIVKTINSILNQNYPDFEIIIVDDGSTDDTGKVVKEIQDQRIKYFYKANEERAVARNYGINKSAGKYLTFIDSDDILYPNHFAEAINIITQYSNPEIFHLGYEVRKSDNKLTRKVNNRTGKYLNKSLLQGNHLSCIGIFLKRDIAILNKFNTDKGLTKAEDWELWLRLAARYDIHYSNQITSCMCEHEGRSMHNFNLGKHMFATELLLLSLRSDETFMGRYGDKLYQIESEMVSLMSLHLVLDHQSKLAMSFLIEAIGINYKEIFKKRFLAIIKHLILNLYK